jgi:hypothetical protein
MKRSLYSLCPMALPVGKAMAKKKESEKIGTKAPSTATHPRKNYYFVVSTDLGV